MFKCLPKSVTKELSTWKEPCEAVFEFLSEKHPDSLAKIIEEENLQSSHLTFAAEHLGAHPNSGKVKKILFPLLLHPDSIVREGAIFGLSSHLDSVVKFKLLEISKQDESESVRKIASKIIINK